MANSAVVGILRTLLTADASGYATGFAKATAATEKLTQAEQKLGQETVKLTPQAERMAKAFGGDKLLYSANNLVAAINKVGGATKLTTAEQARSNATLTQAIAKYAALGKEAPAAMIAAERATRGASNATSILSSTFATLTASFSTALIVNRIVGGLISLGNEAISTAGDLVDLSAKTGLNTETLQQMGYVAGQTGATLEDFTNAAFKLGVNISTGSTAVKAAFAELARSSDQLGMSFEQFQKLSQDEQWKRVAAALRDVTNEQDRNRLGVILAGKTYANVAAAISQDYNQIAKDAKIAGDAQIRAIDDAADAWTAFIHDIGIAIQTSLGNAVIKMNATKQAMKELGLLASERAIQERANDIIALGILKTRDKDIELTQQQTRAQISYRQQLAAVEAELKGLTANQRAEIDAAMKLGVAQDELEQKYGLSEGALRILTAQTKDYTKANKDAAKSAEELRDNITALSVDVFGIADKLEASFDKIADTEMFQQLREEIEGLAEDMQRLAEASESIPFTSELDQERIRKLLEMNAPGSGPLRQAAGQAGETLGGEISKGIGRAFEDIPHLLTSSILHSGSFLNGLKAIGIQMADAIVEPLLKEFAKKLAGVQVAKAAANFAGVATTAGSSYVASEVAGTAASAGGGGVAAGGGGSSILMNPAFWTNPWTIGIGAGIALGTLAWKKGWFGLNKGGRSNDARDKFLAQFAAFDTKRDANNPPGFYGLDQVLTKFAKHDLFTALVSAHDPKSVRKAEEPIAAFFASMGRQVKMFNMGGFVPPGAVQPAMLHGGMYGEDITPRGPNGPSGTVIHNHWHVNTIDERGIRELVFSREFTHHFGQAVEGNAGYMTTSIKRGLK